MKVLYFHPNSPDYLYESLLHGLRKLLDINCVDIPRYDSLYAPLTPEMKLKLQCNNGFSIYGLLDDDNRLHAKRYYWENEINNYDLIIIADPFKMWNLFNYIYRMVGKDKIAVIDGHDFPAIFPFSNLVNRIKIEKASFFTPIRKVKYFKRELYNSSYSFGLNKLNLQFLNNLNKIPENIFPISMSIPSEKITWLDENSKTKNFVDYIVDKEVASKLKGSFLSETGSRKHLFKEEKDYYTDLQKSRFGITTKRAGWDSLRHYEYAANGVILCFKNLDQKPVFCAPHDLNQDNCVNYFSYEDLVQKLNLLDYNTLLNNTYKWIESKTTENVAKKLLNMF